MEEEKPVRNIGQEMKNSVPDLVQEIAAASGEALLDGTLFKQQLEQSVNDGDHCPKDE